MVRVSLSDATFWEQLETVAEVHAVPLGKLVGILLEDLITGAAADDVIE